MRIEKTMDKRFSRLFSGTFGGPTGNLVDEALLLLGLGGGGWQNWSSCHLAVVMVECSLLVRIGRRMLLLVVEWGETLLLAGNAHQR